MKAVALVLLFGVFIAHDTANWIAEVTGYSPAAVFYMEQGTWTVILSSCLLVFVLTQKASLWRTLGLAAIGISIVEGSMIPVCRLAVSDISLVPRGTNLCDYVTGLPVSATLLTVEIMIVCWIIGTFYRNDSEG